MGNKEIKIGPQPGPQARMISCPCHEIFYGGARGGGKSFGVLIDWIIHQQRYQGKARGILFRRSYPELEDMLSKSREMFPFFGARYKTQSKTWEFPSGATLKFRHLDKDHDAHLYQGHEFNWMCFDEAGNWPNTTPLDQLRATLRSADGVRHRLILTGNPGGPGHNWLKKRYIDPIAPEQAQKIESDSGEIWYRTFIPAKVTDNKILLRNDPGYIDRLKQSGPDWLVKAWVDGDWDIVAGGALDDVWDKNKHIIEPFEVPKDWRVDRSFDWGSSKPFAVCWWAEANGEEVKLKDGSLWAPPKGTMFLIAEYYGWNGNANEGCKMLAVDVARKIKEFESKMGLHVKPGPADSSIFDAENGVSIADDMARVGVKWTKSDKSPGSRVSGLERMRQFLSNSLQHPMENPGLFIFDTCRHFIRTVPVLPRDEKKPDDVDTDAEDHIYDAARYKLMDKKRDIKPFSPMG